MLTMSSKVLIWIRLMDQCDSLIIKLITMLLDWYSGDINEQHPRAGRNAQLRINDV